MNDQETSPIRVMRIITRLHISGPVLQALLLNAHMTELGYESVLVTGAAQDDSDTMMTMAERYGIEPLVLPILVRSINPFVVFSSFWKIYRLMREMQPDVVHTHTTTAGFLGRIAARLAGVPVVVHTMHVHPFRGYYDRFRTFFFIMVERIGAYFSDSIITLSAGLRNELVENYRITSKNRITILPIGFDLRTFTNVGRKQGKFRQQWQIPEDVPLIGIIGRLLPVKNHGLFVDAARLLQEKLPNARFVIVGDGETRRTIEKQIQKQNMAQAITFTGWVQEIEQVYSDLDVLVTTSHNEGTPMPIIEALAAGCPVVATRVGGIPDLLDGGKLGKLIPSGDVPALVEAILDTLENPPDSAAIQAMMIQRYSIDRLAHDMHSLYRGLLAKKRD